MRNILGVYSQLPLGSSDKEYEALLNAQLKPLLTYIYQNPEYHLVLRLGVNHFEWLEKNHPEINMLISDLCRKNQVELLASSYNDSILSLLPTHERSNHIEKTITFLRKGFGKRPRGLWCYHQVFNSSIVPILGLCSLDYLIISSFNQSSNQTLSNRPFYMDETGKTTIIFPTDDKYSKLVFELTKYKETSEKFLSKMEKLTQSTNSALNTIMINLDQMMCCDGSVDALKLIFEKLGSTSILPSDYLEEHEISKISYLPAGIYGRDFQLGKYLSLNQMIVEDNLSLRFYNLQNILRNCLKDAKKNSDERKLIESLFIKANNAAIYVSYKKDDPEVKENVLKSINEIESILSDLDLLPNEADLDSDQVNEFITSNKSFVSYINSKGACINRLNLKSNNHDYAFHNGNGLFTDFVREDSSQKVLDLSSRRYQITSLDKNKQDFFAKSPVLELGKRQFNLVKWFKYRQNSINVSVNIENLGSNNFSLYSYENEFSLNLNSKGYFFDLEGNPIIKETFVTDSLLVKCSTSPFGAIINLNEPCKFYVNNIYSESNFYKYTQIKISKSLDIKPNSTNELNINLKFEKTKTGEIK